MKRETGKKTPAPAPAPTPASAPAGKEGLVTLEAPTGAEVIDSGDVDVILSLDPGDAFEGVYRGYKEVKNSKFNTLDRLHKFEVGNEACGVWGTVTLDGALSKVKEGETVWVGYLGKSSLAGGNTMHQFKVARLKVPF